MYQTSCSSKQIRQSFFDFFIEKNHQFIRSSPVNATGDSTLLFTNAGMNQFKAIFIGENKNNLKRVYNSQKCIRISGKHNDLEVVGKDTYHHTFFEMLGNWSFGDYGKKESILWAWELLTEVWKIPKERLFVTVHDSDDEAKQIWLNQTDLDEHRIMIFGDKDNFWEMGDVGPCGPCSEIHYDNGSLESQDETFEHPIEGVNGENDRFIEIWNLVFIQFQRLKSKKLEPLKSKYVDTGMGFERICAVLQGVHSNYDIDLFKALIKKIEEITKVPYQSHEEGIPHRILADHIRALVFSIADGVTLSNGGQGYVMRRLLRRASRYVLQLNQTEPILCQLVSVLVSQMSDVFPELKERESFIISVIQNEEQRFQKTLGQGLERFQKIISQNKKENFKNLTGEQVFLLYDTYGFPLDLTILMAEEKALGVDIEGYEKCMQEQNDRGRSSIKFDNTLSNDEEWVILDPSSNSNFLGYDCYQKASSILRYRKENDRLLIVLKETPFYPEGGGQKGDHGTLTFENGVVLKVKDTFKKFDMIIHDCVLGDAVDFKNQVVANVNQTKRQATAKNHSCTHLLQQALIDILGGHIQQQGSMINDERLRFDFTHFKGLSDAELKQVTNCVNEKIQSNLDVSIHHSSFDEAKENGVLAFFSEQYGSVVRAIKMSDFSHELCGGTHVQSTGEIGCFVIVSESGIAAGVRRIEALTGFKALEYFSKQINHLNQISSILKVGVGSEVQGVEQVLKKLQDQEESLRKIKSIQYKSEIQKEVNKIQKLGSINYLFSIQKNVDKNDWKEIIDSFESFLSKNAIFVLMNQRENQFSIVCLVHFSLQKQIQAEKLINEIVNRYNGKGGGRPSRSQARIPVLDDIEGFNIHVQKVILEKSST